MGVFFAWGTGRGGGVRNLCVSSGGKDGLLDDMRGLAEVLSVSLLGVYLLVEVE